MSHRFHVSRTAIFNGVQVPHEITVYGRCPRDVTVSYDPDYGYGLFDSFQPPIQAVARSYSLVELEAWARAHGAHRVRRDGLLLGGPLPDIDWS